MEKLEIVLVCCIKWKGRKRKYKVLQNSFWQKERTAH